MKSLVLICLCLSFPLYADDLSVQYSRLKQKQSSPSQLKEAIAKGKDRASVCKFCHGVTGNSRRDHIPNLASQNAEYLLYQIELFASKKRNDKIMSELAGNLTSDDRINIALFYSLQKVKPVAGNQLDQRSKGAEIFHSVCATCHGKKGHGKELLPRIAGQPAKYLHKTLRSYQKKSSRRPGSPMQTIAASLSKEELNSVVSYISSMQ